MRLPAARTQPRDFGRNSLTTIEIRDDAIAVRAPGIAVANRAARAMQHSTPSLATWRALLLAAVALAGPALAAAESHHRQRPAKLSDEVRQRAQGEGPGSVTAADSVTETVGRGGPRSS